MPRVPLTLLDRLTAVGSAAVLSCCIFAIAFALLRSISKNSERKRIHGRPILWWVTGMTFIGSCYGAYIADNITYHLGEVVGGMGGFGILIGLAVGNVHGFVNLIRHKRRMRLVDAETVNIRLTFDEDHSNPYAPPADPR